MIVNHYTPTQARQGLFGIIRDVNTNRSVAQIVPARGGEGAAIISLSDWRSIQETLLLEQIGVMDTVRERECDDSGFTDAEELDWDDL